MFDSLHAFWYRIRARFNRDALDAELAEEMRLHAELLEDELIQAGLSPEEAKRRAAIRFGNTTKAREATRERWSFGWIDALLQDTRYAFRFLQRSPGFTVVAVLSLALGIGANATVFTVADKLLFSAPAGVADADGLLMVNVKREYLSGNTVRVTPAVLFPEYFAIKDHAQSIESVALYTPPSKVRYGRGPLAPRIKESMVTPSYFEILGVRPVRGRFLLAEDEKPRDSQIAAVVSHGFWQREFGGADSVVGARYSASGLAFVIVGVAPRHFSGTELDAADVWVPLGAVAPTRIETEWKQWGGYVPRVLVRLREGVSPGSASTEITTLVRRLPDPRDAGEVRETVVLGSVIAARGPVEQRAEVKVSTRLVMASVLVLLAACANLANLLLVRALTRRREIALRLAIGMSRTRLVTQMLLESLILALSGSILALLLARWGGAMLRTLVFPDLQWASGTADLRVFAFAMLCGTVVAFIATMVPAFRLTRADVGEALRSGASQLTSSKGRLRQTLLVVQVALSVVLIVGAAAFSKSLNEAYRFDMGIDVDRIVTMRFSYENDSLTTGSRMVALEEAARRVRNVPGVERVAIAPSVPLAGNSNNVIRIPERQLPRTFASFWNVTPELQGIMGFRLLRGRWITAEDVVPGAIAPILITQNGANSLWPGADPIGRCVTLGGDASDPCRTVVGVIGDLRQRSLHDNVNMAFLVGAATPKIDKFFTGYVVARVRSAGDRTAVIANSRTALLDLRPDLSALEVQHLAKLLETDYRPLRLGAVTFGSFALLAILLASVGLYGILSFSVTQRFNEFGVRAALGARAVDLIMSVMKESAVVVGLGVAAGAALSWYASTAIAALLFQSSARELLPYVYAAVVLCIVALIAALIPALRASRVDPATALRAE
ncbi:MAG: ADOP family duplicated permease [Gemmatimonas sp.]